MGDVQYPEWKKAVDDRINQSASDLDRLVKQAPNFFLRIRNKTYEHQGKQVEYKWFEKIPEHASPSEWRERIHFMQLAVMDAFHANYDCRDAMHEIINVIIPAWQSLLNAYEVQGCMLMDILDKLGMESEESLMEYAEEQIAKGNYEEVTEKSQNVVESKETMPF
jgi:phage-related protein